MFVQVPLALPSFRRLKESTRVLLNVGDLNVGALTRDRGARAPDDHEYRSDRVVEMGDLLDDICRHWWRLRMSLTPGAPHERFAPETPDEVRPRPDASFRDRGSVDLQLGGQVLDGVGDAD